MLVEFMGERLIEVKVLLKWVFIVLFLGLMLNNLGGGVYFVWVKSWKYVILFGNVLNML